MRLPTIFSKRRPEGDIYKAIRRQQRALLKSEDAAIREMVATWRAAERSIRARLDIYIRRLAEAQASGLEISPNWAFQIDRYFELLATIGRELNAYGEKGADVTERQQRTSGEMGVQHGQELMRGTGVATSFVQVPIEAVQNIVGVLQDGSPLRDLFSDLGPHAVDVARRILATHVAAGKHPYVMARALRKEMTLTRKRAELITRTESLRAYRESQRANYKANDDVITGWRWASARDRRTCPICLIMDGTVHDIDEQMATHPGCRCTQAPIPKYRAVKRQTGEDYIRSLPESEQRKILGPTRLKLWKEGLPLQKLVHRAPNPKWGPSMKLVPLKKLPPPSTSVPPPKPRPTTPPMSGATQGVFRVAPRTPKTVRDTVAHARSVIDAIHGPGRLPEVQQHAVHNGTKIVDIVDDLTPIRATSRKDMLGYLSRVTIPSTGVYIGNRHVTASSQRIPVEIGIHRSAGPGIFAHEFGHFIDAFGDESTSGTLGSRTGQMTALVNAMLNSDAMKRGLAAKLPDRLAAYLRDPGEIWARAYFQYIATKSQDKAMLNELAKMRSSTEFDGYWQPSDQDFESVIPHVEAVLRRMGMMQ